MADERVVLSLEGQEAGAKALLDALRAELNRVEKAGAAANKGLAKTGKGASEAATRVQSLTNALRGLAALVGITLTGKALVNLGQNAIAAAADIHKMSQQTGIAAEQLSILRFAVQSSGADVSALGQGMKGLSNFIDKVNRGSGDAARTLRSIGLSAADIKGLSLDQVFKLIADRLDRYADGATKAAIAQDIFGRAGLELLPVLKDIAGEGLTNIEKKARDLGVVLSSDTAKNADAFQKSMFQLKAALQGNVTVLIGPLIPKLTELINELARGGTLADKFFESFEKGFLLLPKLGLRAPIPFPGFDLSSALRNAMERRRARSQGAPRSGHFDGGLAAAGGKPDIDPGDPAAAKARVARAVAALQAEAQLAAAKNRIIESENSAAYDRGLKSIDEYYATRRQIIEKEAGNEISVLRRQRAQIASLDAETPAEQIARQQAVDAIDAQIAQRQQARTLSLAELDQERYEAAKRLAEGIHAFETSIASARGATFEAALRNIDEEIRKDRELLLQRRQLSEEDRRALEAKRALLVDRATFDDISARTQRELSSLARDRQAIEEQARRGLISVEGAEIAIANLERARLPILRQLAEEMERFARSVGDPELVSAAAQFSAQLDTMGFKVNDLEVALGNFRENAINALGGSLAQFLGSGINQVHNLGDAFRQMALSAVQSIQQIIAQLIALRAIQALTGLFAGPAAQLPIGNFAGASPGFTIPGKAAGGLITGPGTGTSDSIIARLSAGEFVISAAAVRRIGAQRLAALNAGLPSFALRDFSDLRVPRYAAGGLVEAGSRSAAAHSTFEGTLKLDRGLILETMRSAEGARIHVEHTGKNRKAIGTLLGR